MIRAPKSIRVEFPLGPLLFELVVESVLERSVDFGNCIPDTSIALNDRDMCMNSAMCLQPRLVMPGFSFKESLSITPICSLPWVPLSLFGNFLFCRACSADLQPERPDKMTRTPSSVRPQLSKTSFRTGT